MEIHFKIIGILLLILGVIHAFFPRYFNWKTELTPLSIINRQMMVVHTFFIGLTVFLMGLLCLLYSAELIQTPFGRVICLGLGAFWFIRLIFQLFVYSALLWKGKRFETFIHILFIVLWAYISVIFLGTVWVKGLR